jgi:hypothetical protein
MYGWEGVRGLGQAYYGAMSCFEQRRLGFGWKLGVIP